MQHVMHIRAYERKAELGGGFAGCATPIRNGNPIKAEAVKEIFPTYEQAKAFAMRAAADFMGDRPYRRAYIKSPANLYRANIWA